MMNGSGYSLADIAAATGGSNNRGNDGWGGDGWGMWIWVILIFAIFGGWGNGFGFGGNGAQGALTRADLCADMNFQGVENGIRGIQQGLCDGFYAQNTTMLQGFNGLQNTVQAGFAGVDNAICNLGFQTQQGFNNTNIALMQGQNALQAQLADCCCTTQRAIDGVNYNMATNTCNVLNTMNSNTRDIIDSQNAGTRAILDYLCQDKISTLQQENQTLRLAASQANQNAAIGAMIDASAANIIRRTGNDCPIPAYVVPNPNCCYDNYGFGYRNNGGCGCNSGCGCA